MSIQTIQFKGHTYPAFQSEGFAAQFAIPFAKHILKYCQTVYDVGCNNEDWKYPGAIAIDPRIGKFDAMNFPETKNKPDAIFSSHMLEHYNGSWVEVLDYWHSKLCSGGIVFLYLPHYSQVYWRSWNNKKHVHNLSPELLRGYFEQTDINGSSKWSSVIVTEGYDLNNSFYAIAEKV